MAYTVNDLLTGVLKEIRVARAGDVPSPDDLADVLSLFNELIDEWNGKRRAIFNVDHPDFTLVPGLSPHTIGPSGSAAGPADPTFVVTYRPTKLLGAQLNLGSVPPVFTMIHVRDEEWYRGRPLPGLAQTIPTDVYYEPTWTDPNNTGSGYGSLYFYGVPQTAYGVRLWLQHQLAQITDPTLNLSLPQGYRAAVRLTLAERAASWFGQIVAPSTAEAARLAREEIFGNNDPEPRIATADAGLGGGDHVSAFNYANRSYSHE